MENGKRKSRGFSLIRLPFANSANGSFSFARYLTKKRTKVTVSKRIKRTKRTCPNMLMTINKMWSLPSKMIIHHNILVTHYEDLPSKIILILFDYIHLTAWSLLILPREGHIMYMLQNKKKMKKYSTYALCFDVRIIRQKISMGTRKQESVKIGLYMSNKLTPQKIFLGTILLLFYLN
jgi:hypothetical protein